MRIVFLRGAALALGCLFGLTLRAQDVSIAPPNDKNDDDPLAYTAPAAPLLSFVPPDASLVSRPDEQPASPAPDPDVAASPQPMRISIQATSGAKATPQTTFRPNTGDIVIRWRGENLPLGATVRLAWVAEDVGGLVDPGFVIDQSSTEVETSTYAERFTISRPRDGWAAGKYRVDLYVNDELKDTLGVTIRE